MDVLPIDELLVELRIRRWTLYRWGSAEDPRLLAATYRWDGYADVVILRRDGTASGYRTPTHDDVDMLRPDLVIFQYHGRALWVLRAVLALAEPGSPDAPVDVETPHAHCRVPRELPRPVVLRQLSHSPQEGYAWTTS